MNDATATAPTFNVYCDESTHLLNDGQPFLVLGALWCPADRARAIAVRCREIKEKHGLPAAFEVKWAKVSGAKGDFYLDLLDYFFDEGDLHFRGVVAPKAGLRHEDFGQSHDDWYYKMYYQLLGNLLKPGRRFRVYLDIKDTRSKTKVSLLHDVLANSLHDFDHEILEKVQQLRSHEAEQVQLADLLIGAVNYANRGLSDNAGKNAIVARLRERTGHALKESTWLSEEKFNLFHWRAR